MTNEQFEALCELIDAVASYYASLSKVGSASYSPVENAIDHARMYLVEPEST